MYSMYGQPFDPAYRVKERENKTRNMISVRGIGKVEAKPDTATLQIAVTTTNKDAAAAQQENRVRMNQLIQSLASIGIQKQQIETVSYTVFPQYDYSSGSEPVLRGYEVTNTISITTQNLDQIGQIYDTAFENGANRADRVQFSLSNQEMWINEALNLAAKQALDKAEAIAQSYQLKLQRKPVKITEEPRGFFPMSKELSLSVQSSEQTPIFVSEIEIIAELTVVFTYQ